MKTLIIITLLLLVLTIVLIALIAKKFLDKTDHILASNALVSNNITDNAKKILDSLDTIRRTQQDNFNKISCNIEKGVKVNGDAHITIIDLINVSNRALVNSINAIEEKNNVIAKILEEIAKFNEHYRRVTEMLDNKIIAAKLKREEISDTVHNISDSIRIIRQNIEGSENTKIRLQEIKTRLCTLDNLDSKLNAIISKVCSETESIQIPDELLDMIAEYIGNKIIEIQAKNSSSNIKTKKPSLHKAKTTGKLRIADKQDNSQQERIDEIAKQQNK